MKQFSLLNYLALAGFLLLFALFYVAAQASEVDGKICTVRCVSPHPKPILNRALWLCFQYQPLIIVLAAPSMELNLSLPPEVSLPPEPVESPVFADVPAFEGGGGQVETVGSQIGEVIGGGYVPPLTIGGGQSPIGAPETDPSSGASAVTLLFGLLAVMRRRR